MNERAHTDGPTRETLARIEGNVWHRLAGRLRAFHVVFHNKGLLLRGQVHTYHAKQLAQHAVMEASSLPIHANEVEVSLVDLLAPNGFDDSDPSLRTGAS